MLRDYSTSTSFWLSAKEFILVRAQWLLSIFSAAVIILLASLVVIQSFCIITPGLIEVLDNIGIGKHIINETMRKEVMGDDDQKTLYLLSKYVISKIILVAAIFFLGKTFIWGS